MKLLPIIAHMRKTMPQWFSDIKIAVDAAASYEYAVDKSRLDLPAFYLMLGEDAATDIQIEPIRIEIDEPLSVIVVLKNTGDETGKNAQDKIHDIRNILLATLLGYRTKKRRASSLVYTGSKKLFMDSARYVHEFKFKQVTLLENSDGWDDTKSMEYFEKLYTKYHLMYADESTYPNAEDRLEKLHTP